MTSLPTLRSILLAAALTAISGPALADDAPAAPPAAAATTATPPADRVVATVNGEPITELDLIAAAPDLRDALAQYPQEEQFGALVKGVIDIRLMARAAEAAGIDKQGETAHLLAYVRERTLRNSFLAEKLNVAITDASLKARYDAEVAKFVPEDELHATHILVATEDEAKAIIAQLDQGGDFAAIAKEKSIDKASGAAGGDLGFFSKETMVKPFADAAFALDLGTYTKVPVKSEFGFHIIKALEKRKQAAPTFEARQAELRREFAREIILAEIDRLHASAKIVVVQPEPPPTAPAPDAAPAEPKPAPAPAQ